MNAINTDKAAAPLGDYAQAVRHGNMLYLSLQLPIGADNDMAVLRSLEEQAAQVLENIRNLLDAGGSDISKILRLGIYVKDMHAYRRVEHVCAQFLGDARPARIMMSVSGLPEGFSVAMDAIAHCD